MPDCHILHLIIFVMEISSGNTLFICIITHNPDQERTPLSIEKISVVFPKRDTFFAALDISVMQYIKAFA